MTLVNVRAAFEKAITDAVADVDPRVKLVYDNVSFTTPGKTVTYITNLLYVMNYVCQMLINLLVHIKMQVLNQKAFI